MLKYNIFWLLLIFATIIKSSQSRPSVTPPPQIQKEYAQMTDTEKQAYWKMIEDERKQKYVDEKRNRSSKIDPAYAHQGKNLNSIF